jgi:hypothetical protein
MTTKKRRVKKSTKKAGAGGRAEVPARAASRPSRSRRPKNEAEPVFEGRIDEVLAGKIVKHAEENASGERPKRAHGAAGQRRGDSRRPKQGSNSARVLLISLIVFSAVAATLVYCAASISGRIFRGPGKRRKRR